jgi:hypothetical protein
MNERCCKSRRLSLCRIPLAASWFVAKQLLYECNRACRGAKIRLDERLSSLAQLSSEFRIFETSFNKRFECVGIVYNDSSAGSKQSGHDIAKVPCIGTERNGSSVRSGFEHVLTAAAAKTAADERNLCSAPPGA